MYRINTSEPPHVLWVMFNADNDNGNSVIVKLSVSVQEGPF